MAMSKLGAPEQARRDAKEKAQIYETLGAQRGSGAVGLPA